MVLVVRPSETNLLSKEGVIGTTPCCGFELVVVDAGAVLRRSTEAVELIDS